LVTARFKFGSVPLGQDFTDFAADLHAQGYEEVLEKRYPPLAVIDTHVHSFSPKALLVSGEMWITIDAHTEHLLPGGTFELDAQLPHSERYGREGAVYWVGRRAGK
jgi:hypothetical protein